MNSSEDNSRVDASPKSSGSSGENSRADPPKIGGSSGSSSSFDGPPVSIVSEKLTPTNYQDWAQVVRLAIGGLGKLGYPTGILVQLPLPNHINEEKVLGEISLEKDVDGFHPTNIGKLAMKGRDPLFVPCTPKGCLELLLQSGVPIKGKKAVVVGRSNIVGLPVALLLLKADATVTVVHSRTNEPEKITQLADIVIAAAGQPMMIRGDWIKRGAAVIDVGTNAVEDMSKKSGYRLVGDVNFEEASKVAGWITPVPGGVGPMTVAMLLRNTLESAKRVIK